IKNFLAALMGFVFLYIIIDMFSTLQEILKNHPSILKVVELYIFFIPTIITQTSPIAALLATLFTIGHFNQSNEIIAMRASGISIFHIIKPIIFAGLVFSLGIFLMNEIVVPYSQRMTRIIKDVYIEKKNETQQDATIENVAVYGFNNRLFFINKLHTKTNTIEGLTILEHDNNQNVRSKVYAEKAVWRNNRWVLYQCFIYHLTNDRKIKGEPLYFSDTTFKIEETPQDFLVHNIPVENMNIKELAGHIVKLSPSKTTATIKKLQVDLFQKTSFPFTTLIIILLGIPSSIVIQRKAVAFSSIGLCIGIGFLFYTIFSVSIALGKAGVLPPLISAWISHIVFGAAAIYFIKRIP
ncbi:MAG TPA: LptF/LptG family permease, partial [Candidatus Omnitrophota bacterium]|nr:LptF/LptG family permease [Candidatus Omnitrophota bacterium]